MAVTFLRLSHLGVKAVLLKVSSVEKQSIGSRRRNYEDW